MIDLEPDEEWKDIALPLFAVALGGFGLIYCFLHYVMDILT